MQDTPASAGETVLIEVSLLGRTERELYDIEELAKVGVSNHSRGDLGGDSLAIRWHQAGQGTHCLAISFQPLQC